MMKIRFPRRPWRDTLGSAVLLCALAAACAAPAMAQNLTGAGATLSCWRDCTDCSQFRWCSELNGSLTFKAESDSG